MSQKYRAPAVKTFLPQIRNTLRSACRVHLLKPEFVSICRKIEKSVVSWHACLAPSQPVHAVVAFLCNKAFRTYKAFKFLFHLISKMQSIFSNGLHRTQWHCCFIKWKAKLCIPWYFIFNKIWGLRNKDN